MLQNLLPIIKDDLKVHTLQSSKYAYLRTLLFNRSFQLLFLYRLGANFRHNRILIKLNQVLAWLMGNFYASEIHFDAKIGKNVRFEHPLGIVIGRGVIIHDNVIIYQHVTLGNHGKPGFSPSYPEIHSGVIIYVNSSVIGGVTVEENAIIGAHSLVLKDVPANCLVVGIPAKILSSHCRN